MIFADEEGKMMIFADEIKYSKSSIDGLIDEVKAENPYDRNSASNAGEYNRGWNDALNRMSELLYSVED